MFENYTSVLATVLIWLNSPSPKGSKRKGNLFCVKALKYPDVGDAYVKGDHFCWSGYYHGVMEGILRDTIPEELPRVIDSICDGIPGKETYSFDYYNTGVLPVWVRRGTA